MANDSISAFKVLCPEDAQRTEPHVNQRDRSEMTRRLLSGGMKPNTVNINTTPTFPMPPQQQSFQPYNSQPFPQQQQPQPYSSQQPFHQQQQPYSPSQPPSPYFGNGFNNPPINTTQSPFPSQSMFNTNQSPFQGQSAFGSPRPSMFAPNRFMAQPGFRNSPLETAFRPTDPLRSSTTKYDRQSRNNYSRSNRLSRSAFSRREYYGIDKKEPDEPEEDSRGTLTKEDIREMIRSSEGPDYLKDAIERDVMARMKAMEKRGYRLPREYDSTKHDLDAAQMALMQQQLEREQERDETRGRNVINMVGFGLPALFNMLKLNWVKTGKVQEFVQKGLEKGDFDSCLEQLGSSLRDTILDNPKAAAAFILLDKIAQSNREEVEQENDQLFEAKTNKSSLSSLNKQNQESFVHGMSRRPLPRREPKIEEESEEEEEPPKREADPPKHKEKSKRRTFPRNESLKESQQMKESMSQVQTLLKTMQQAT